MKRRITLQNNNRICLENVVVFLKITAFFFCTLTLRKSLDFLSHFCVDKQYYTKYNIDK